MSRHGVTIALLGLAAGILAADIAPVPVSAPVAGGLLAAIVAVAVRAPIMGLAAVAIIAFSAGAWRADAVDRVDVPGAVTVGDLAGPGERRVGGIVIDDPRPRGDRLQLVLDDLTAEVDGDVVEVHGRLLVWLPRGLEARSGDLLRMTAEIELAEDFDGFAYREYLARQGIGGIARVRDAEVVARTQGLGVALAGLRTTLLGGLNDLVPEPEAALGAGILLGVRAAIAPEINDAFATAGLTHVVAISGWNIAIVAAIVTALVRPLGRRPGGRWTTATVAAATVGGYVLLAGASPSVVRAALMAGAMLVARLGGSRAHAASALSLAALVMLLAAPPVLWDVGFQLSLLATAGLIWFGTPIERRMHRWPGWIREPAALTLAAQLTTLPVILVNFERLSLVAPLANVLVVPFVPLAMLGSAVAAVVGCVGGAIAVPVVTPVLEWLAGGTAWLLLRIMILLGTAVASLPNAAIEVSVPPILAIAWLPLLGLARWIAGDAPREAGPAPRPETSGALRLLRPAPVAAALVLVLGLIGLGSRPDGLLHLTVLDIGQGDAILIELPDGEPLLVDGGPDPELTLRRIGANMPFFERRMRLVVVSHPHQDHVAGLVEVVERHRTGAILHAGIAFENSAYGTLLTLADDGDVRAVVAHAGARLTLSPMTTLEIIYPSAEDAAGPLPDGDINNGSLVLLLRHGAFTALLTGDAEAPVEAHLLARGLLPATDVLKVGHHGSASSTTPELLEATRPAVAVISAGEGNEYGHPAPETLDALSGQRGITVLRTDLDGDVEIATDGRSYRVRTDAGWSAPRPAHGSIGAWPSPIATPPDACSRMRACPTASSSIPRASLASPSLRRGSSPRPRSRSTAAWSRRWRCCMTSTRWRSGAPAASTASSARAGSRRWATPSSPCRSPPTRSITCSTTSASPSAGPPSSWRSPTGMWRRPS